MRGGLSFARRFRSFDGLRSLGRRRSGNRLFDYRGRSAVRAGLLRRRSASTTENLAQFFRDIVVDRARVSLLFGDAQFGEFVEQFVSFNLQLARQHVNANLVHK
jgi:hypothetical protein